MNNTHHIGDFRAFANEKSIEIGEITSIGKNEKTGSFLYDFVVSTMNGITKFTQIKEDNIIYTEPKYKIEDNWLQRHMNEINNIFGKNISENLIFTFDSLEDVSEEMKEFFYPGCPDFKQVDNKWVGAVI